MTLSPNNGLTPLRLASMRRLEQLLGRSGKDIRRIAEAAGRYYRPFDRRRVRGQGKWRHIDNPCGELKAIQSRIQKYLLREIGLPQGMNGGIPGRSIKTNAAAHVGQPILVAIDLRDCFPRTNNNKVYSVWQDTLLCSPEIASLLTPLTTFQHRLPQGAPTSTTLANLTLLPLYFDIEAFVRELGIEFTFFVDDIGLSGYRAHDVMEPVIRLIQKHGHAVRRNKIHIMPASTPERLAGTTVNRKISVDRRRRRELRSRIYMLAGIQDIPDYEIRSIRGQIAQMKWLCPEQGLSLEHLATRLLPAGGVGGPKPRTDETRPCRSTRGHRYSRKPLRVRPPEVCIATGSERAKKVAQRSPCFGGAI